MPSGRRSYPISAEGFDTSSRIFTRLLRSPSTTGSSFGTGGMATKLSAAEIATASGADMVIALAEDFRILHSILEGDACGTLFRAHPHEFYMMDYLEKM